MTERERERESRESRERREESKNKEVEKNSSAREKVGAEANGGAGQGERAGSGSAVQTIEQYLNTPINTAPALPPFDELPTFNNLTTLTPFIKNARNIPSGNPQRWHKPIRSVWLPELYRLALVLEDAVKNPTPLALFKATVELLTAPGRVIGPLFQTNKRTKTFTHDDLPGSELQGGPAVNAALRKIAKGQEGKAFKLLCSNGVAEMTPETLAELTKLHPARQMELTLPKPAHAQVVVDPATIAEYLSKEATNFELSKDVFGWSPALLYWDRAVEPGFLGGLPVFWQCWRIDLSSSQKSVVYSFRQA